VAGGAADLLVRREARVEEDLEAERRGVQVVGHGVAARGRQVGGEHHGVERCALIAVERGVEIARRRLIGARRNRQQREGTLHRATQQRVASKLVGAVTCSA
jgi:hypothetical protein